MKRSLLLFAAALSLVMGANSVAHAQDRAPARHFSVEGYFIGEFFGEYRLRVDGDRLSSGDIDLDPTLGGGLRATMHMGVFALGLMTEFRGYGNSDYEDRDFALDISPFLGVRIPVAVSGSTVCSVRGTIPIGFTMLNPNNTTFGDDSYYGFNTGALGGVEITFGHFGIFTDVGVRYHRVYARNDIGGAGNVDASLSWAQLSVNAGVQLVF